MKVRYKILGVLCLLGVASVWCFWPRASRPTAAQNPAAPAATVVTSSPAAPAVPAVTTTNAPIVEDEGKPSAQSTNRLVFRLSNTKKSIKELTADHHAILLENAFIDTTLAGGLTIPSHLRASNEPGAYIVQSRGAIDGTFRAAITGAGGTVVSYIPNNAYLVQVSSAGASVLRENSRVQAVLPYEPYYKVQSSLLGLAVEQKPLPEGTYLTLGLFGKGADATVDELKQLGAEIMARDRSPFGPIVRVRPPTDWIALAKLSGVQILEPVYLRKLANDLTRVAVGQSTNTTDGATNNYLGLTGKNVMVEVNDTGIDPTHPDFSVTGSAIAPGSVPPSRVFGDFTNSLSDTDGHGTHVAGIIAGNGSQSRTPFNVGFHARGSVTNADFRGKAPDATLFSVGGINGGHDIFAVSDAYLQEQPALTNALISNNSWTFGDSDYDLGAASYDAAVRDALPQTTGPQPVLFVFAAGNSGGGNDGGSGGSSDSIGSPGTAKNVITVGALEELRNITNIVTALDGTSNAVWAAGTDSGFQVAGYSSRGNVGIQTEGSYGRFKPDVVAPGTFTVSTRSQVWDEYAYYNPTNFHDLTVSDIVATNALAYGFMSIPQNAVGVVIQVFPNQQSPSPFPPDFPIYVSASGVPDPSDPTTFDIFKPNSIVSIPPDAGKAITDISVLRNGGIIYAIGEPTNHTDLVSFDVLERIITTNDLGNQLIILSNLNNSISGDPDSNVKPHYYRYESGTSMATPAVSGVLACMQDFFTNTLKATPSPALLKAMLINGARLTGNYKFAVTNTMNFEGWGLVNLPNSVPAALTNTAAPVSVSNGVPMFFLDQSPTNAVATGDRRSFQVQVQTTAARLRPLRVTLAWTDPPGNPAAAIKLVNDLDLVVTNLDNPTNPVVYFGNAFAASGSPPFSSPGNSNSVADNINNVENIYISPLLGTNYTVTVVGHAVNVNAVTLEQTNIVQDFALVISSGDGSNTNGIMVTPLASTPTPIAPHVDFLASTNGIYFNQFAGSSAPWLSTNDLGFFTNQLFAPNSVFHIGQTNQWHFYVITNTTGFTNAAFIVFLPNTAAIPREGVFASTDFNSTRPEADLELFVASPTTDALAPGLTNLNTLVISNCLAGVNGDGASIGRGGSEFVAYSNSVLNQIYYIGVQCQDQMAGQFAFVPIFSQEPFSTTDKNGNTYVRGVNMPVTIPDGNNAHPGVGYVFGLSLSTATVKRVIVTNTFTHQNFGDLLGSLSHSGTFATLNNHDGLGTVFSSQQFIYDDSGQRDVPNSVHTDGPGTLENFRGKSGSGLWLMNQIDDSFTQTGSVTSFMMKIEPHRDLRHQPFSIVTIPAGEWFYDFVDVPVGFTNLLVVATNLPPTSIPPILLGVKKDNLPQLTDTNLVQLTNSPFGPYPGGANPGNQISTGPPLTPGRYFVGLFNPDSVSHDVLIGAILTFDQHAVSTVDVNSTGQLTLLDDAVVFDSVFVTNTLPVQHFNVGLRVDHPRISDLVFHLISPDGTRYLLMENRGGQTTNGCGADYEITNIVPVSANGGAQAATNTFDTGVNPGTITINYDFFSVPDQMQVYNGNQLIYDTGFVSFSNSVTLSYSNSSVISILMNPNGNPNFTAWTYTVFSPQKKYAYLSFTEDTNLTMTPIKFAVPPFVPLNLMGTNITTNIVAQNNTLTTNVSGFEAVPAGEYSSGTVDGWNVAKGQVSVLNDFTNAQSGNDYLALANGSISRTFPTVPGTTNVLQFAYRGPGVVSWWRGENNGLDEVGINNGSVPAGVSYVAGTVGQAFNFPGTTNITVPDAPSLNPVNELTVECWVYARPSLNANRTQHLITKDGECVNRQYILQIADVPGTPAAGVFEPNIWNSSGSLMYVIGATPVQFNTWYHVAMTYDGATIKVYVNGVLDGQSAATGTIATGPEPVRLGGSYPNGCSSYFLNGMLDEPSIYQRALSASEIQAIYQAGSLGKFDPATTAPQNLAKMQVSLAGTSTNTLYGANGTWQNNSITFVATSSSTTVQLDGLEPGILLDSLAFTSSAVITNTVTNIVSSISNLYYLPEQDISGILNTDPSGTWTMEVLDNRAGATNFTGKLLSWQLEFQFANTNFTVPPSLPSFTNAFSVIESNLLVVTNSATSVYTNAVFSYSLVDPPTGCTIDSAGVITWSPDEGQGPSTNTIVTVVSDGLVPPNFATNSFTVIVLESNLPPVLTFPRNGQRLRIMETVPFNLKALAFDSDLPTNTLTFALVNIVNVSGPTIDTNSFLVAADGTITWTPDETNGPSTNLVSISVTDFNPYTIINPQSFSVTNSFTLVVLESNSPPVLTLPANQHIPEQVPWSAYATATDPDIPTNTLTFSAVSIPVGMTVAPDGLISWTPDETQGPGVYTNYIRVTDFNPYSAPGTRNLSVTNSFILFVDEVNIAPFWPTNFATNYLVTFPADFVITNAATDPDIPTNTLVYTLLSGPTNAQMLDPARDVIFWPSTNGVVGSSYTFIVQVTDTNPPAINPTSFTVTNIFTVTIISTNTAPFWTNSVADFTMYELSTTNIQVTAVDTDLPPNTLTYSLLNAPPGMIINSTNGVGTITWTPSEAQGPGVYTNIQVIVSDNVFPISLTATNTPFSITVLETNSPPFWTNAFPSIAMNELTTNIVVATATDSDIPTNTLTYVLTNSPAWASIDPNSGLITLTPGEADGPTNVVVTVIVFDNGLPSMSAITNFNVEVDEVNSAPQFVLTPPNQTVLTNTTLIITNAATDSDIPANTLFYSLLNPPSGASIDSSSGILTLNLLLGTNVITTVVTDDGIPPLSATNSFTVIVATTTNSVVVPPALTNFVISSIVHTNIGGTNGFLLTWFAPTNAFFHVQWTTILAPPTWSTFPLPPQIGYNLFISPTNSRFQFFDDGSQTSGFGPTRYYRLSLITNAVAANTAPAFGPQATRYVTPGSTINITNTATDAQAPPQVLTYALVSPPVGVTINTNNGIITWTPALALAGTTNNVTTTVTDNGSPNLSATNTIKVVVFPLPVLGSATLGTNGVTLAWSGFTNEQFQVRWATNLAPAVWMLFPNIITSTTGAFTFTDTNAPFVMKFYQLILLP